MMAKVGLYQDQRDVTYESDHVVLNLKRTPHGGLLNFYYADGKITISQSNPGRKTAIWRILEPITSEYQGKPTKSKKKLKRSAAQWGAIPSPAQLLGSQPY